MKILFFALGILLWTYYIIGNIGWIRRKGEPSAPSSLKSSIYSCIMRLIAACVCLSAFYFSDLRYLWLLLGIIFLLGFLISCPSAFIIHWSRSTKWFDQPSQAVKTINVTRCTLAVIANTILLILWVYSWRHLFT